MVGKELTGKTITVENGHLSYEIDAPNQDLLLVLARIVGERFGFSPTKLPAVGLNEVITDIELDGVTLGIGWDIWSGCYFMANDEAGDSWVRKIAAFLNEEIEKPKYRRYTCV